MTKLILRKDIPNKCSSHETVPLRITGGGWDGDVLHKLFHVVA
jgi:hypothetical protein